MSIFSLADHYSVWTKGVVVNILTTLGDTDFQRSASKEALIEQLEAYFVPDIIQATDAKGLLQLAEAVSLLQKGRKYKRDALVSLLTNFQNDMKDKALIAVQSTPEDTPEFTRLARIVFTTDPELHDKLESEFSQE